MDAKSRGNDMVMLRKLYLQIENQEHRSTMTSDVPALFESFRALQTVEVHAKDRHVRFQRGSQLDPEEVERKPDEWKDELWA